MSIDTGPHQDQGRDVGSIAPALCDTCVNSDRCFYRSRRNTRCLYCEMFIGFLPAGGAESARQRTPSPERIAAEDWSPDELIGLCANCSRRMTCTLPKPMGGVWNCEEYT